MSALPPEVAELVAALDAVLVPHGFAAAQGSVQDAAGGFTWCCAGADWVAHFPHLPPDRQEQRLESGRLSCVDVVVEVHEQGSTWALGGVRLEGRSLAEVLHDRDRLLDAGRVRGLEGRSAREAVVPLVSALGALLTPA